MARQKGTKNAAPANAEIAVTAAASPFSPGAEWLSIKQAAETLGLIDHTDAETVNKTTTRAAARLRAAIRSASAFKAAGAVQIINVDGYDIAPLIYLHRDAVAAYGETLDESGKTHAGGPKRDRQRWIIDVKHDDRENVFAMLAQFGIEPRNPNARKPKAVDAAASEPADVVDADVNADESGVTE